MKSREFAVVIVAVAAAGVCSAPVFAQAQAWPARPVRIIVPFAPGGGVDTVSRLLAQKLGEQTGASFIVENRPGGGGLIGAELVAKAAPDRTERSFDRFVEARIEGESR